MAIANPDTIVAQPVDVVPAHPKLGTIVLLGSVITIGAMSIDLYLPSLPVIGRDLHAGAAAVQQTMSAFFVGLALSGLISGPLSDRFGRRPTLLIGVAIYIAASVACALAPTVGWLIAGRFVEALGAGAGQVVTRAIVRDRYRHQDTARILSLLTLVVGVAPLLAPTLGAWLITIASWRAVFGVLAAVSTMIGLAALVRLTESRSAQTAAQAGGESVVASFVALLGQRRLVGYILGGALNGATIFTYVASAPDVLITQFGLSPHAFAGAFAAIAVGVIGSSQVNRGLLARYDSDRVLGVASLAGVGAAVALVGAAVSGQPWLVMVALFAALASFGFVAANATAGALAIDPLRAGATSALIGSASFAVGAVATWPAPSTSLGG